MAFRRRWMVASLVLGGLSLPVIGALGAGFYVLGTERGSRWLIRKVTEVLDAALVGARVEIGEIRSNVFSFLVLRDLGLFDEEGHELLGLDALEIDWTLWSLATGSFHVTELRLDAPRVALSVLPGGKIDLLEALGLGGEDEEPPSSEPWQGLPIDVVVDNFTLRDGAFSWRDGENLWQLQGISTTASLSSRGRVAAVDRFGLGATLLHDETPLPISLAGGLALQEGDLVVQALRLDVGPALLRVDGRVGSVEIAPDLALRLGVDLQDPAALKPLIGDPGLVGPIALELGLSGPLSALLADARLGLPEGVLALTARADLVATPPSWSAEARLGMISMEALLPGLFVDASTLLDGDLRVAGEGLSWPEGLRASGDFSLNEGRLWGQPFRVASGRLRLEGGQLEVEDLLLDAPIGQLRTGGRFDLVDMTGGLDLRLEEVALRDLARFGVTDLDGRASFLGRVAVRSGGIFEVDGRALLRQAAYGDHVRFSEVGGPLRVRVQGSTVDVTGDLDARGVSSHGAWLGGLSGPYEVRVDDAGVAWKVQARASEVRYSAVRMDSLDAGIEGGVVGDEVHLNVEFDASNLEIPGLPPSRGGGRLLMKGSSLDLSFESFEDERRVMEVSLGYDLASGQTTASRVFASPNPEVAWENVEPLRVRVADTGIEEISVVLREVARTMGEGEIPAELRLAGRLGADDTLDLHLLVTDLTLDPLATLVPDLPKGLAGRTRLELRLGGTLDRIEAEGRATVRDLRIPGAVRSLDADLDFQGDGNALGFSFLLPQPELPADKGPGRPRGRLQEPPPVAWLARGQGRLPFGLSTEGPRVSPDAPIDVEISLGAAPLERWSSVLEGFDGAGALASANLRIRGTPRSLRTELLAAVDLPLDEGSNRARLDLGLRQEGERLEIDALVTEGMRRQADLKGSARTRLAEIVRGWAVPEEPPGEHVADPSLPTTWLDDLSMDLVFRGIDLDTLGRIVDLPPQLHGRLQGGLHLAGSLRSPELGGALQVREAALGQVDLNPATLTLAPGSGGYDIAVKLGFGGKGDLEVAGFVPLAVDLEGDLSSESILARQGLDLRVSGAGIPLEVLPAFSTGFMDAAGLLRIDGRVVGSLGAPRIETLHLASAGQPRLAVRSLGVRYENLEIDASLSGVGACPPGAELPPDACEGLLQVNRIGATTRALKGLASQSAGRVELSGSVNFVAWEPRIFKLKGEANRMRVIDTTRYGLVTTGRVNVTGTHPAIRVSGKFVVDDARLLADEAMWLQSGTLDLDPSIHVLRSGAPEEPEKKPDPGESWFRDLRADLDVDLSRNTWITTRMPLDDRFGALYASLATVELAAQLEGKVKATWVNGDIGVKGEVKTLRGTTRILGADFEVKEGTVAFVGADPTNPFLDVKATHRQSQWGDVDVSISGSRDTLDVSFSSEQYPDETDIVSILVLGRPLSELSREEGQSNAGLLAIASAAVMGEIERSLGGAVFDLFEIETSDSGGLGAVRMGHSLGDRFFILLALKAEADPGENLTEAIIDWNLGRSWSLQIVTGDAGASSADIYRLWRF